MKTQKPTGIRPVRRLVRPLPHSAPLPEGGSNFSIPSPAPDTLRVIPFGGTEEVGINMTAYEYGDDIIVVDMGLGFPPSHIRGVNYIIPNYRWLEENKHRIRAILVTHAHLDHIGGIPYILPRIGYPPIYSMPLSIGFIKHRLTEFSLVDKTRLHAVNSDQTLRFGNFTVQFFRVNHNIPDSVGIAISTPAGRVIHTGDWKLDYTPGDQRPAELDKLALWGAEGILALLGDSTNAKKPGYCLSEQKLHETIERIFESTKGRILFSSNALIISRIQQVMDAAALCNRKVAAVGRSMLNNIEVAVSLGYLKIKPGTMISLDQARRRPDKEIIILTTGAQGEDNAGLARMARDDHREVKLKKRDTVIISANPIPGNEGAVDELVANLTKQGVHVIFHKLLDIHISGHAQQEELKLMMNLVRPKYLIPVHGEHHMLTAHANLAKSIGMADEHVLVPHNGIVYDFKHDQSVTIQPHSLPAQYVFVDETAIGYVDPALFCDQEAMATAGAITVAISIDRGSKKIIGEPEIVSRGFIYLKGNEGLIREIKHEARKLMEQPNLGRTATAADLENYMQTELKNYIMQKTGRQPLIVPAIVEI